MRVFPRFLQGTWRRSRRRRAIHSVFARIRRFFAAVPGSVHGHLNGAELLRIAATALSAGGGLLGVLEAVRLGVGAIFPAPADAALAALILTTILETLRRLGHGADPSGVVPGGATSGRDQAARGRRSSL
jgi:hypothetical protein